MRDAMTQSTGVLVVGHGTRDARGVAEFLELVEKVRERLKPVLVEPAFLELARPTIAEGIDTLVAQGVDHVTALPLLLFAAGHAQRDIPAALREAANRYPTVRVEQASHLGCEPQLLALSALRFESTLATAGIAPTDAVLLMVGRGSYEPTANAEMWQFARLRWEAQPSGWLELGFTAMTRPTLDEALSICGQLPFANVIVQPHLLFQGQLVDRIGQAVAEMRARFAEKCWLTTDYLGPHPLLVEAAVARLAGPTVVVR
jgi:sirohydrochlorin cobaltochelatase